MPSQKTVHKTPRKGAKHLLQFSWGVGFPANIYIYVQTHKLKRISSIWDTKTKLS